MNEHSILREMLCELQMINHKMDTLIESSSGVVPGDLDKLTAKLKASQDALTKAISDSGGAAPQPDTKQPGQQ